MTPSEWPSDPLELLRTPVELVPPEGAQERVAARLAVLSGGSADAATAPHSAAGSASLNGPSSSRAWGVLGDRFVRWSLLPLGVGVALGIGGQALLAPRMLHQQAALPAASSAARTSTALAPAPSAEPTPPLQEPVSAPMPPAQVMKSTLAEEQALLDRARKELASDESARALTFLEQHARRFPRGRLTEEREAMWINVLVLLERKAEAQARGQAFAARFPNSLMSSSVRAALRAVDVED